MSKFLIVCAIHFIFAIKVYSEDKCVLHSEWLEFVGKYPYEVFESKKDLLQEIKRTLGSDFERFDEWFTVQSRGTLFGNSDGYFLILEGGKPHNAPSLNASIVVDISNGEWWLIMRNHETNPDIYEIYSSSKTSPPESIESIVDWQVDVFPLDLPPFKD